MLLFCTVLSHSSADKAAFTSLLSPDCLILLILYEVTLCSIRKTDVDGISNATRLQSNKRVEKSWVLCREFFKLESYTIEQQRDLQKDFINIKGKPGKVK